MSEAKQETKKSVTDYRDEIYGALGDHTGKLRVVAIGS